MNYISHNDDNLCFSCIGRKNLFEVITQKILTMVGYVTRDIKWFDDHID